MPWQANRPSGGQGGLKCLVIQRPQIKQNFHNQFGNQARQHLVRAVRVRKVPAGVEANIQAVLCTQKYYQYSTNGTSSTGSCTEQDFF
jgi:hypothetical protein